MHAEVSGLGDYFAEDEMDAIRMCREVVSHLNWRKPGPAAVAQSRRPVYDAEELLGIVSRDLRQPVDVRDVIARVVDGSRFEEFKTRYGSTVVCGWASVHGYPVGILGNNGVIHPKAAEKAGQFIQLCNQIDVPLIFLQNITGYMVGQDAEAEGIIKKGSQMLNAVTNSTVPHLTVIIGSSYGAGTYGMSGRAFGNRFTFLWPTAKIAVMGPKQIAGRHVPGAARPGGAEGRGFDEEEDRQIVGHGRSRRRRKARWRWPRPGPSATTASSTPETRARFSASASRWFEPSRSRAPRLRGLSAVTFTTLLIANRGEIARRDHPIGARTHGHAHGRRLRRGRSLDAPFVRDADEAVRLTPGYLDSDGHRGRRVCAAGRRRSTPDTASSRRTRSSRRRSRRRTRLGRAAARGHRRRRRQVGRQDVALARGRADAPVS